MFTSVPSVQKEILYVGLACLLPSDVHALCTCAGLFFAQLVNRTACGELYHVEVTALSHYFSADVATRRKHVRTLSLLPEQMAQLLEWDRRLAGMATCDVREVVALHVAEVLCQRLSVVTDTALHTEHQHMVEEDAHSHEDAEDKGEEQDREDADLMPLPTLFVSHNAIRQALDVLQITSKWDRRVQTALLIAARETIFRQLEYCHQWERHDLERQLTHIHNVQQWRRRRRGWQRVVTLVPARDSGCSGWDVIIGVPQELAA